MHNNYNIIRIPHSKNVLPTIRTRMRDEGHTVLLCETVGLSHTNYYMCRNQDAADDLLEHNTDQNLWYISDFDKPIRLSIDFDYKTTTHVDEQRSNLEIVDFVDIDAATAAQDLFAEIKERFEGHTLGIADRSGFNADKTTYKFSKRLYTDLVFKNTLMLQLHMKQFVDRHGYDKAVVDLSIYSKNRLYPVVGRNTKADRTLNWEQEGTFALSNPNNSIGTPVEVTIPPRVKERQLTAKESMSKKMVVKPDTERVETALFLDLLDKIPADHWDDYMEWFKLGSFCKTYFNFEVFHDISKQSMVKYVDEQECRRLYDSALKPIHPGFVVNVAKQTMPAKAIGKVYANHRFVKSTLTEKSIAKHCVLYFGDDFKLVGKQLRQWHPAANCWRPAGIREFNYKLDDLAHKLNSLLVTEEGENDPKLQMSFNRMISNRLKMIYDMFTLYVDQLDPAEFDQHHKGKWFFKNGHYCFADRRFHSVTDRLDHNTEQMVSKTAFSESCEDTASKLERLVEYFEQIFPVADDFAVFKNMIGCAVRGEHQKRLLVIYGIGHNGKSSFLPLLMKALGGYSVVTSNDLLTEDISTSKPRSDLQRLQNRRLAIIQEPSSQKHFNSSAIKAITGGDTIECRGYHQNQIQQFRNTALIVVSCNDLPNMDKMDVATANRFVCIEARSRFIVQHEYDAAVNKTNLFVANPYYQSDAFYDDYTEATQHLLIQWAAQYEGVELKLTEDIKDSVDSYLNSNGVLDWFEEHYEQATEKEFVKLGDVWEHFNAGNQFEMNKKNFFKFVKEHPVLAANFKRQKKVSGKVIKNVLLRYKPRALACESDND